MKVFQFPLHAISLAFCLLPAFAVSAAQTSYSTTDLGTYGGASAHATGINESGAVSGFMWTGQEAAFITGAQGTGVIPVTSVYGGHNAASAINDLGQATGDTEATQDGYHAFLTGPGGANATDIGPAGYFSSGIGMNNAGQVVGYYGAVGSTQFHAFMTGANGQGFVDLGTLGGSTSWAYDINASGQVVGNSAISLIGWDHAFITGPNGTAMKDLGTLGGTTSYGHAINDSGWVVGSSYTASSTMHAFLVRPDGLDMQDLTPDASFGAAAGINGLGQIVGYYRTYSSSETRAFLTDTDGKGFIDLSSLVSLADGVHLQYAFGINGTGQIIAEGSDNHKYLLTPMSNVPEPSVAMLEMVGCGLLALRKRHHKRHNS